MHLHRYSRHYFRLPVLAKLLIIITISMLCFGLVIHLFEPNAFPTVFEGIWWAFVTGSTVGYGDYVPSTLSGRIIAMMLILGGGGVITFYMAVISAKTIKHEEKRAKGTVAFPGHDHLIIIGWNERTKNLITFVKQDQPNTDIVLIDSTLRRLPDGISHIHFVRGDPTADSTLVNANSKKAKFAVITADPGKEERLADQASILTTIALRGNNEQIRIVTEILTKEQVINAKRAGADQIIHSNHWLALLDYESTFGHSENTDQRLQEIERLIKEKKCTKP